MVACIKNGLPGRGDGFAAIANQYWIGITRGSTFSTCFRGEQNQTLKPAHRTCDEPNPTLEPVHQESDGIKPSSVLAPYLEDLTSAQQKLAMLNTEKDTTEAEKKDFPELADARKSLFGTIENCFNYIEVMAGINSALFAPIIEKLNEVIVDVMQVARARKTREENERKEGGG